MTAKYQEIANRLRGDIVSGRILEGRPLPSEETLAKRYGVSRPTVRNAVNVLKLEGLVTTINGRGTFVRGSRTPSTSEVVTAMREAARSLLRLADALERMR